MDTVWLFILLASAMVVLFDFTNGFHDASNMVAPVIASRAMSPVQSVLMVGTFTFLGPVLGGTAVANTIGNFVTLDDLPTTLSLTVVLCGLFAATAWNLVTWWRGLPSSSSHALVGGLCGVVMVSAGPDQVVWGVQELAQGRMTGVTKVLLALVLSPLIGFWFGFVLQRVAAFGQSAGQSRAARCPVADHGRPGVFTWSQRCTEKHGDSHPVFVVEWPAG